MRTYELVGLVVIVASGAFALPSLRTQETALPSAGTTAESSNEVVLSEADQAVLHTSFIASSVLRGDEKVLPGSGALRVLSFACFVTVNEEWETSLVHGFDTVNAQGAAEVLLGAGYGKKYYEVRVSPVVGHVWGTIESIDDLRFAVKSPRAH